MSNIIIWYKYPEKTKINLDEISSVYVYLNGVLRTVVTFNTAVSE